MQVTHNSFDKGERIQIRIDQVSYDILKKAASFSHASLSTFVKEASLIAAKEVIQEQENFILSNRDWKLFLGALDNPSVLNPNLKAALEKYKDSSR